MTKLKMDSLYRHMEKAEMTENLMKMTKANLLIAAEILGINLRKSATKTDYINEIAGYYSFMQLNDKMAERDRYI
jgi:hypothetical protein